MADFLENILRAMKLVPERVDSNAVVADLDESLQAPPQMDRYLQGFQQGLLGNKADYDQAQKVFINPNSTDEQRQSAQLAMNQAHDRANYTRGLAKRMGYNLDNYGANTSLDDATKKYQADTQSAIRQLLNQDMTSEQYYDEAYRRLHEAGLPMRQAQQEAARRANLYKAQRLAKYNTAMQMYGQNGDGTLNDLAIQMLGNTMTDSPELAELYYKTYASPSKTYDNNVIAAREKAARDDNLYSTQWQKRFDRDKMREELGLKADYNKQDYTHKTNEDIRKFNSNAETTWNYGEKTANNNLYRALKEYYLKKDIDIDRMSQQAREQILTAFDMYKGLHPNASNEEAADYALGITRNSQTGKDGNNSDKPNAAMINAQLKSLEDKEKALIMQYTATDDFGNKRINPEVYELDEWKQIQAAREKIGGIAGQGSKSKGAFKSANDWNIDGPQIQEMTSDLSQKYVYKNKNGEIVTDYQTVKLVVFMNMVKGGANIDYALGATGQSLNDAVAAAQRIDKINGENTAEEALQKLLNNK